MAVRFAKARSELYSSIDAVIFVHLEDAEVTYSLKVFFRSS